MDFRDFWRHSCPPVRGALRPGKTEQSRTHLMRPHPSVKRPSAAQAREERTEENATAHHKLSDGVGRRSGPRTRPRGCPTAVKRPDGRALRCPLLPSRAGGSHCSHPTAPGRFLGLHGRLAPAEWLVALGRGSGGRTAHPRALPSPPTERSRSGPGFVNPSTFEHYRTKSNAIRDAVKPSRGAARGRPRRQANRIRDRARAGGRRRRFGAGLVVSRPGRPRSRRGPTRRVRTRAGWREQSPLSGRRRR